MFMMNFGFVFFEMGKRVFLVDVDFQFNFIFGLIGMKVFEYFSRNVGMLMIRESEIEEIIVFVKENFDFILSYLNLLVKEIEIINVYNCER